MISTVYFYKTGLNERNFAYDKTAHNNILSLAQTEQGGEIKIILSAPLAFGQVFNIDVAQYLNVHLCTYIKIVNDYENGTTQTRFAFINNFMSLANGNYAVSYELDDWTNFILSGEYNYHIDGFTQRANIALCEKFNDNLKIKYDYANAAEREPHNDVYEYITDYLEVRPIIGKKLPTGYKCAIIFLNAVQHAGVPQDYAFTGTYTDYDALMKIRRYLERNNSSICYTIIDPDGYTVPFLFDTVKISGQSVNNVIVPPFKAGIINNANIEKIIYFDYFPSNDLLPLEYIDNRYYLRYATGKAYTSGTKQVAFATDNMSDISYTKDIISFPILGNMTVYLQGVGLSNFSPQIRYKPNFTPNEVYPNEEVIPEQTYYTAYLEKSLYKQVPQSQTLKAIYNGATVDLPINEITLYTEFICGISADGETAFIKTLNTKTQEDYNELTATAPNINIIDLAILRDYKSYKNAKNTGIAAITASAIGGVVSVGTSIASQNVAGVVGGLSGMAQGIITGAQRLQGLTPIKQVQANNDYSTTVAMDLTGFKIQVVKTEKAQRKQEIINFEKNGIIAVVEINEYLSTQRMRAFNAIQTSDLDIHGIPQQAARRISETFAAGVTLWTAPDVGNKDVINYPL